MALHRTRQAQQNAFIESFNGRLRDELLNETLFTSLAHARETLVIWKDDYNTVRPHSGLGNLPPAEYAKLSAPGMQWDGGLRSRDDRSSQRHMLVCWLREKLLVGGSTYGRNALRAWGHLFILLVGFVGVVTIVSDAQAQQQYRGCYIRGVQVDDCHCKGGCGGRRGGGGGGYYYTPPICPPGYTLTSHGTCLAPGAVDCGNGTSCPQGNRCGSNGACVPAGWSECGSGTCSTGYVCAGGDRCMPAGNIICGRGSCPPNHACGSSGRCLPPGHTDCNNGQSCSPGWYCTLEASACRKVPTLVTIEERETQLRSVLPRLTNARVKIDRTPLSYLWGYFRRASDVNNPLREYEADIQAALQIIFANYALAVPGPAQRQIVRDRVRDKLEGLMTDIVMDILHLVQRQIDERLEPFWNDGSDLKRQKREALERLTREVETIRQDARSEIPQAFTVTPTSSHILFYPPQAFYELRRAALYNEWNAWCGQSFCRGY